MAVPSEDPSTPATVYVTTFQGTTASFTPPDASMVVAMAGIGWGNAQLCIVSDSVGGTAGWETYPVESQGGDGGGTCVAAKYFETSPGPITVTANFQDGNEPFVLTTRVLVGAGESLGAVVQRDITSLGGAEDGKFTVMLTPESVDSLIYGVSQSAYTDTVGSGFTPVNADTVLIYDVEDSSAMVGTWGSTRITSTATQEFGLVDALHGAGGSIVAVEILPAGETPQPLAPPTNIVAQAVSSTQIDLSWSFAINAVSYDIERNGVVIANTSNTTYSDTELTPSTQYDYRIRSVGE